MFKVIIWASDGSEHAERALEYARGLAEGGSARLIAVHVKEIAVGRAGGYPVQVDEEEVERKIQRQVNDLKDAGIDANYKQCGASAGGAAHAIADAATEVGADLVVVGTRGQGPISGLLLGSVTHRLLHVAPCPVLAVPPAP
jgi:nucleotide-binding universal stress UspA family protein